MASVGAEAALSIGGAIATTEVACRVGAFGGCEDIFTEVASSDVVGATASGFGAEMMVLAML